MFQVRSTNNKVTNTLKGYALLNYEYMEYEKYDSVP